MEAQSLSEQEKPEPWAGSANLHFKECGWRGELASSCRHPEPRPVSGPSRKTWKVSLGFRWNQPGPGTSSEAALWEAVPRAFLKLRPISGCQGEKAQYKLLCFRKRKVLCVQCNRPGSIPGSAISPVERNGHPLQYSCLKNSMDKGTWWAIVHGVAKSWTWLHG